LGTGVGLRILFSAPLLNKKVLKETTKNIKDYIPRLEISEQNLFSKSSNLAQSQYRHKIANIVNQLVTEYRESIEMEAQAIDLKLQTQTPQDENMRKKLFMFHLNKSGAYFTIKEELKAAVVQVIREVIINQSRNSAKSHRFWIKKN
jgi:predicted house-cleaning noncanonical NTP pyrophosphatase (MazG superfamily)